MTDLYHFSEEPGIECFVPRPVAVPSERAVGEEWLNAPLVWAIDAWHSAMYLFPRECPRILLWPVSSTSESDRERWFGLTSARMIAYIEWAWLGRLRDAQLYRYQLPSASFVDLNDAGMWVSQHAVMPDAVARLDNLPAELAAAGVELRVTRSLLPLRDLWETTSLHVSGIRLRNAEGWGRPSRAGGP